MATAVAFQQVIVVLPASDLNRARQFYADKLGLAPRQEDSDGMLYEIGASAFLVYEAAGPANGQHTQAGFLVDDLDAAMSDLSHRGVSFEQYDLPSVHTEGGVFTTPSMRGAFFKDSEGNILALNELTAEGRTQFGL
jgi:predicted enzyme related to lactoylglutathione lyase